VSCGGQLAGEQYGGGADASSRWDIGSIRKSFTSALAGQLISEGIVSLDAPVCERWPQIAQLSQRTEDSGITLRQLLGATSGWLTEDPPGRRFRYNNAAFTAAERVLAGAIGREPAPEVVDRFARPLGLENFVAYHRAMPFDPANFGDPGPKLVIECCLRDLLAWGDLWAQDGDHEGRQLIPRNYLALATRPAGPPPGLNAVAAVCADTCTGLAEDYLDVPMGTTGEWITRVLTAIGAV
jgi:CubicO group peptidase (beta-lactamase class C family)